MDNYERDIFDQLIGQGFDTVFAAQFARSAVKVTKVMYGKGKTSLMVGATA
jgi:hypothetical protein